jgi:hypothetical protein
MLIAFGVVCVYRWVMAIAWRRMWLANRPRWLMPTLLGGILIVAAVPWWHMPDHFRDRTDSRNAVQVWIEERLPPNWTIVVPRQLGLDTRRLAAKARRIAVVDLQSARHPEAVRGLLSGVPGPAVILAPRWGADSRFPGHELPGVLNELSSRWRVMKTFGTNDVLVNYSYPNPWGDPAFAVAVLE